MSYLHCHGTKGDRTNCHWGQDDFWSDKYNPITCLKNDYEYFMKDPDGKCYMDEPTLKEMSDYLELKWYKDEKGTYAMRKDLFIWEIKRMVIRVENMKVYTYEQWEKVRADWVCPKCGSKHWDID